MLPNKEGGAVDIQLSNFNSENSFILLLSIKYLGPNTVIPWLLSCFSSKAFTIHRMKFLVQWLLWW